MEISSAPYLIDPTEFGLSDLQKNQKRLQDIKQFSSSVFGTYRGKELVEYTKNARESFIIMEHEGAIIYLVHLKKETLKQFPVGNVTQAEVWRASGQTRFVTGLAPYVFQELLRRTGLIVSDTAQTSSGKRFWADRLDEFHYKGYAVGVFDTDKAGVDWATEFGPWFRVKESKAWGREYSHEFYRFVIAKKSIAKKVPSTVLF